jgi:DNA-binding MarR family transcriptional regulator
MSNSNDNDQKSIMDRDDQMILSVLSAVEEEPDLTQKDLASRLGVAVGMVNSYLKRVIYKGYVKTRNLQRRRLKYLLTPSGIKEKTRLTYEFLEYSYHYIREIRQKTLVMLEPYCKEEKKRVVFYGSGEVAELTMLTLQELGMHLVAVVDEKYAGKNCVNHDIQDNSYFERSVEADIILVLLLQVPEPVVQLFNKIPNKDDLIILTLDKKYPRI